MEARQSSADDEGETDTTTRPTFSVVLCTYNRSSLVPSAVARVLEQSWTDFELIVVNDGSTDETREILDAVADPRLRALHRDNGGLSAARNTGISAAEGDYLVFLDDDDRVTPDWLAALAGGIDANTGFVSCRCQYESVEGELYGREPMETSPLCPEVKGPFLAGTFALHRTILEEIGGYAEEIRVSHQTELLLRAIPAVKQRGMTTRLVDDKAITIQYREQKDRPLSQPADLLHGAEYLIDRYSTSLASNPHTLANYHAIAGVNAAKLGDNPKARRHFARAVRRQPGHAKHIARLGLSLFSPIARWTWRLST